MRILFVAPYPISHIRIRAYGFVSQLAKQHEVTVLCLCSDREYFAESKHLQNQGVSIISIYEKTITPYLRSIGVLGTSHPLQVAFGNSPRLALALKELLTMQKFELLHVDSIRSLGVLPQRLSIPVVWDAIDCISFLYEQGSRFGATPLMRVIGSFETKRIRAYERLQLQRFRQILVTSERDRLEFLKLVPEHTGSKPLATITVLPHGVDQQYFRQYTCSRQPETLVFSGKMSFHANIVGVLYLVEQILPLVWAKRPTVQLIIAGSNPPAVIRRMARDPRITVTGHVSDLRPYIAQARVAVCPLPYAVGIQNKVLEAMTLGTPIIVSSPVAAGLSSQSHHLLVADDPASFAAAIFRLLEDDVLWHKVVNAGIAYIAAHHDWDSIMERLHSVYMQAIYHTSPLK